MSRTMTMTMNSTGSQCSRMVEVSTPVAPPPPSPWRDIRGNAHGALWRFTE